MVGLTVASFWVYRPEDFPAAADYPAMLKILDGSCRRLGIEHVVLTDAASVGYFREQQPGHEVRLCVLDLPRPLMQATTEAHAQFLAGAPLSDVLFVGADSIFLKHPARFYPRDVDMCVTYRPGHLRYPINNGAMMIRARARELAAALYRRVADGCGPKWGDDQRQIVEALLPMPPYFGTVKRAGMSVAFLPMRQFNDVPAGPDDPCRRACMLHFRGRKHKPKFFPWAKRWGFT